MKSFDDELHDALAPGPDEPVLRSAGDEGLIEQVAATFRSRMRRWIILIWCATLFWMIVLVSSAVAFFRAETTRDWILFAVICLFAAIAVGMLKMWYWMEMNRFTHTRELKRVELQVARLAEALRGREEGRGDS